jgi:DNA-directed RNA polymerase subunit RPC12/RpoP
MAKVKFSCTQCSTRIEASDRDANVRFECPSCGKSLSVEAEASAVSVQGRQRVRRVRGLAIGLALILVGIGLVVCQLRRPASRDTGPAAGQGRRPLGFLQWDRMTWEGWMQGRHWRVSSDRNGDDGLVAQAENDTDVALRFRGDGRPATLTIVSRAGDQLRNCLKAAYTIDPYLAQQFAAMVKTDPEVMTNGRLYQLGDSRYAMGGAQGNALVVDYVGTGDKRRDVHRLPAVRDGGQR